jgi:hypothetical protein
MEDFASPLFAIRLLCVSGGTLSALKSNNPAPNKEKPKLMDLPADLIKQIMLEVISEDAMALKGANRRFPPSKAWTKKANDVISILPISEWLNQDANEALGKLTLNMSFTGAHTMQTWQARYWNTKLKTTPWRSFSKIKIRLKPNLPYGSLWGREDTDPHLAVNNVSKAMAPVALTLCNALADRVQSGHCQVQLICYKVGGSLAKDHAEASLGQMLWSCWNFSNVVFVLESWQWLKCSKEERPIHVPNTLVGAYTHTGGTLNRLILLRGDGDIRFRQGRSSCR